MGRWQRQQLTIHLHLVVAFRMIGAPQNVLGTVPLSLHINSMYDVFYINKTLGIYIYIYTYIWF